MKNLPNGLRRSRHKMTAKGSRRDGYTAKDSKEDEYAAIDMWDERCRGKGRHEMGLRGKTAI